MIVGAGIAGLAAGRALLDDGWDVTLYERADGLPATGTALGMWRRRWRRWKGSASRTRCESRGFCSREPHSFVRTDRRSLESSRASLPTWSPDRRCMSSSTAALSRERCDGRRPFQIMLLFPRPI
ncbi:FAD-dependent oxidoreductase [Aeromicrobium camelliae]